MKRHMIRILILFVIISSVSPDLYAQKFTNKELSEIDDKIKKLLNSYKLYGGLTEDDEKISSRYVDKLNELFLYPKNKLVYNDLEDYGLAPVIMTLNEYINFVKKLYPSGFGIQMDIKYSKKPKKIGKNTYVRNVEISKRIFGFMKKGDGFVKYDKEHDLVVKIQFTRSREGFGNFKIVSVLTPKLSSLESNKSKTSEIDISITPGITSYSSKFSDIKTSSDFGYSASLKYIKYFNKGSSFKIGMGIGVGLSKYSSGFKLDKYTQDPYSFVDIDGDTCDLLVNMQDISDQIEITYFDIIINLLRIKKNDFLFNMALYFDLGLKISIPLNSGYTSNGIYTTKGYYSQYTVELFNVDWYGYNDNKSYTVTNKELEFKTNTSIFIQLGLSKAISKNIAFHGGIYYCKGLVDIVSNITDAPYLITRTDKTTTNNYYSFPETSKSTTQIFGVTLGMFINF